MLALILIQLVLTFLTISCGLSIESYNRSILEEKYPKYGKDFVLFPKNPGPGFVVGYLRAPESESKFFNLYDVTKDVTFKLYTRKSPKGTQITRDNIKKSTFSPGKKTKVITHGWLTNGEASPQAVKDAFLQKYDYNVIVMDWSPISGNIFYPIPMRATSDVGQFYGDFLNFLVEKLKVHPEDIHLIGHSLGAHVSGFAGRSVKKGKVARVTGLDPAFPGFGVSLVEKGRLQASDAQFVDVIHTCAGFLGIKNALGHVDFYPNGGGPPQPGCESILEMVEACSHGTSWHLFTRSILEPNSFLAHSCTSFDQFMSGDGCLKDKPIPLGYSVPLTSRGSYYLVTS